MTIVRISQRAPIIGSDYALPRTDGSGRMFGILQKVYSAQHAFSHCRFGSRSLSPGGCPARRTLPADLRIAQFRVPAVRACAPAPGSRPRPAAPKSPTAYVALGAQVVLSPALGGIVIGQEVGRALGVRAIFAERQDGALTLRRGFTLSPGEQVLVVEDVVTTGGSTRETIDVARAAGAHVVGAASIIDRSGGQQKPRRAVSRAGHDLAADLPAGGLSAVRGRAASGEARLTAL